MDLPALLNLPALGLALLVALVVLAAGKGAEALLPEKRSRALLRAAVLPLALMAGYLAGYLWQFAWPHATADRPWYLSEAWKMAAVDVLIVGLGTAAARMLPPWPGRIVLAITVGLVMLATAHGPWMATADIAAWEGWEGFALTVVIASILYGLSIYPAEWEDRFWLASSVVMWMSASALAVSALIAFDRTLGLLLVMLAVMAGVAIVAGIWKELRESAVGGGIFLALMYAPLAMLVLYYDRANGWPLDHGALVLMACGPLGAAVGWIPQVRRRTWVYVLVAAAITAAFVMPGAAIAITRAPKFE